MKKIFAASAAVALVLLGATTASPADAAAQAATAAKPQIRVDQVGYTVTEAKRAYLLAPTSAKGASFTVRDGSGHTVFTGTVGANAGAWSPTYKAVHPIDFGQLRLPGTYTIASDGAVSPPFHVQSGLQLLRPLVNDAVSFYTVQRDGADVIAGPLHRKPSHLADRKAFVYDTPTFVDDESDVLAAPLKKIAGPVDVEGGWFDAGDFLKFTHSAAYALSELLYVQRSTGLGDAALAAETQHELTWLDKMWDAQHKTLYVQVGIGSGNEDGTVLGDHDVWRLPEADDALDVKPGDDQYFVKFRPVFRAGAPGAPISPNLAGRVSAAFALASQVAALRGDTAQAKRWLGQAAPLFAQAKTTNVGELVTAFPHAFYPEDSWADDMEYGAVELARAGRLLGDSRSDGWLRAAAHWASVYIADPPGESLSLYDTSALAHAELIDALRTVPLSGLDVSVNKLVGDLKRQLNDGVAAAAAQPFGHAVDVANFDAATRSFGFAATARLYANATDDHTYDTFGTRQRNFALGANAWGASLMIGEGSNFPQCPQHQVANLSGSLTGGRPIIKGAIVNGPNGADNFVDLGTVPDGGKACPVDGKNRFAAFDTAESRFLDDVAAWPSVEPALDFDGTGTLALSLMALTP
jgi:endoglucanase